MDRTLSDLSQGPYALADYLEFILSSFFTPEMKNITEAADREYHFRPQLRFFLWSIPEDDHKVFMYDDFDQERFWPRDESNFNYLSGKNIGELENFITANLALLKREYNRSAIKRYIQLRQLNNKHRLMDGIIATEILAGDDEVLGSLSYKVRLRTAFAVGRTPEERLYIFNLLKDAYSKRSSYVHGRTQKKN